MKDPLTNYLEHSSAASRSASEQEGTDLDRLTRNTTKTEQLIDAFEKKHGGCMCQRTCAECIADYEILRSTVSYQENLKRAHVKIAERKAKAEEEEKARLQLLEQQEANESSRQEREIANLTSARLLNLPQELQDRVKSYLDALDLMMLIQVSRNFRHSTPGHFACFNYSFDEQDLRAWKTMIERDRWAKQQASGLATCDMEKKTMCGECMKLHKNSALTQEMLAAPLERRTCRGRMAGLRICEHMVLSIDGKDVLINGRRYEYNQYRYRDISCNFHNTDELKNGLRFKVKNEFTLDVSEVNIGSRTEKRTLKVRFDFPCIPDSFKEDTPRLLTEFFESNTTYLCPHLRVCDAVALSCKSWDFKTDFEYLSTDCPETGCKTSWYFSSGSRLSKRVTMRVERELGNFGDPADPAWLVGIDANPNEPLPPRYLDEELLEKDTDDEQYVEEEEEEEEEDEEEEEE